MHINELLSNDLAKDQPPTIRVLLKHAQIIMSDAILELEFIQSSEGKKMNTWDWISVRDRLDTLSDALDVPPDSHAELATELRSMAEWIEKQGE